MSAMGSKTGQGALTPLMRALESPKSPAHSAGAGCAGALTAMHCRMMQLCFIRPGPPNFFMSLQKWHSPHSVRRQASHLRHRVRRRRAPAVVRLEANFTAEAGPSLPLGRPTARFCENSTMVRREATGVQGPPDGVPGSAVSPRKRRWSPAPWYYKNVLDPGSLEMVRLEGHWEEPESADWRPSERRLSRQRQTLREEHP